ncbi:glycosyltransferase family 2 protein [Caulobacter segnis]|uniref:glycosyltransferase family 2 protein n=1 Tax=Caulobacter segnis TaxID=88688 RepID=UPI0029588132|nr:glycosyltransferase [Caulobacter segnis]UAL08910.1 glycosyltransferase [Caulobacter segnis]
MKMRASIITVNYHSERLIRNLEDVVSKIPDVELIVVDNGGGYKPLSMGVRVVGRGENIGFGAACNLGARSSDADVIVFINPDVDVTLKALNEIVEAGGLLGDRSVWAPAILDRSERLPTLKRPGRFGLAFRRVYIDLADNGDANIPMLYVSGACLATSRATFFAVGGFNDKIFMYGEDLEFCVRASDMGVQVVVIADVSVGHAGGKSSSNFSAKYKRLYRSIKGHFIALSLLNYSAPSAFLNALHLASGIRL